MSNSTRCLMMYVQQSTLLPLLMKSVTFYYYIKGSKSASIYLYKKIYTCIENENVLHVYFLVSYKIPSVSILIKLVL